MTQKPLALFVPSIYALGHLGHVVYVDPNDLRTVNPSGWYPEPSGWYPVTQMTQMTQASRLLTLWLLTLSLLTL
jgi:hypothetical protein